MDYLNYQVEILTADSELSFNNGVIVLVTGILTGKENTGRKFCQVFFLAPQENGYFVLNDVFRFISEPVEVDTVANNHIEESAPKTPLMTDPTKTHAIFVPNLPMNATVEQLEAVFNNFGPIKHNGLQVRSSKQQGTCFGFVEFESASLMQSAIELTMTEGGFHDGLVIEMIALGALET